MKKLSVLAALLVIACGGSDSVVADSSLASDLALASQIQSAQPQLSDTAPADPLASRQAPSRIANPPRTRVVTRPPAAVQSGVADVPARTITAGAAFSLASQQRICTATNRPGDRFAATLTSPVTGANGAMIPSGSSVVLEVASVSSGANADDASIGLRVHSVEFNGMSYPLSGAVDTRSELERTRVMSDPNADKKKVLGGAVAGAIIGQIIGKNTKGTVIGAAAGAATGAVVAKAGEKWQGCLPVGGSMLLILDQAVVLSS